VSLNTSRNKPARRKQAGQAKSDTGPARAQRALSKKEKTRKGDQKTSQVMIELAFLFVLEGGLLCETILDLVGHGHIHIHIDALVSVAGCSSRGHLGCGLSLGQHE